jgi:membrane associated rhomboid family serine protease
VAVALTGVAIQVAMMARNDDQFLGRAAAIGGCLFAALWIAVGKK